MNQSFNIKWISINKMMIDLIQDPSYESYIELEQFSEIYKPLLTTLDGRGPEYYFDYYFCKSPINNCIYEFVNIKVRNQFRKKAEQLRLIPNLNEISEGETKIINKDKILQQIDKYAFLLKNEEDPIIQEKLNKKINKALKLIQHTF